MKMQAKKEFIWIVILFLISLVIILLVGNRLNATWAGGSGFAKHACAFVEIENFKTEFCRGEIISTMSNGTKIPLIIEFGDALIFLDKDTEIKIIDGRKNQEAINVIQGRVLIKGKLIINTREITTKINGTTSFVHYSWLDKIEVSAISGSTSLLKENFYLDVSKQAFEINTLNVSDNKSIIFNPEISSASAFYDKTLNNF